MAGIKLKFRQCLIYFMECPFCIQSSTVVQVAEVVPIMWVVLHSCVSPHAVLLNALDIDFDVDDWVNNHHHHQRF